MTEYLDPMLARHIKKNINKFSAVFLFKFAIDESFLIGGKTHPKLQWMCTVI